jgi:Helix-turn-helix domain
MGTCDMSHVTDTPEVLTLEEVAAYLRLPQDTIARQAAQGAIPGRQIEDTWRFLKLRLMIGCAAMIVAPCSCNKRARLLTMNPCRPCARRSTRRASVQKSHSRRIHNAPAGH